MAYITTSELNLSNHTNDYDATTEAMSKFEWLFKSENFEVRLSSMDIPHFRPYNRHLNKVLYDLNPRVRYAFLSKFRRDLNLTHRTRALDDPSSGIKALSLSLIVDSDEISKAKIYKLLFCGASEVKIAIANNYLIDIHEIDKQYLLFDENPLVRLAFIPRLCIDNDSIELLLKDSRSDIRIEASKKLLKIPNVSAYQIERGLIDSDYRVRLIFAMAVMFTSSQIDRGLKDVSKYVREAFAQNVNVSLTKRQIENGLTDSYYGVRLAISERREIKFTDAQVNRGVNDSNPKVRCAFVKRSILGREQVETGLNDPDPDVRETYVAFTPYIALTEKQIERCIADSNRAVCIALFSRPDVQLTDNQIEELATDPEPWVRSIIFKREDLYLSQEQINAGLRDPSYSVRVSLVKRKNITFTDEQIKIGLRDNSYFIRDKFRSKQFSAKN